MDDYKEQSPQFIQAGDTCSLEMEPQVPIAVSAFKDCEGLGRVAVLESNSLVMLGKIVKVENEAVKS